MNEFDDEVLTCHWHPKVETTLRCYQCGTPICVNCAQHTPVGYICPDCKKGRKQRFERAKTTDYVIAAVVSSVLGLVAGFIPIIGWFTVFVSPFAGGLIAELVWRLVGRRYGRHLWWLVSGGIIIGALPYLLPSFFGGMSALVGGNIWGATSILWPIVHIALAVGAANARLRLR